MSTAVIAASATVGLIITPLQPTIGAEVSGIDIAKPIKDVQRDARSPRELSRILIADEPHWADL